MEYLIAFPTSGIWSNPQENCTWVQQSSALHGTMQLIITLELPLNRSVKNGLQTFLRRIPIDMVVVNHVCKCEKQHWRLQKFGLLFEFSLVFYSGHEIPLIAVGYAGCTWTLCVAGRFVSVPDCHSHVKMLVGSCRASKVDTWVKISLAVIKQTHIGQCHYLPSISFPKHKSQYPCSC